MEKHVVELTGRNCFIECNSDDEVGHLPNCYSAFHLPLVSYL